VVFTVAWEQIFCAFCPVVAFWTSNKLFGIVYGLYSFNISNFISLLDSFLKSFPTVIILRKLIFGSPQIHLVNDIPLLVFSEILFTDLSCFIFFCPPDFV